MSTQIRSPNLDAKEPSRKRENQQETLTHHMQKAKKVSIYSFAFLFGNSVYAVFHLQASLLHLPRSYAIRNLYCC
ncbi:AAA domain-containing protein [Psidium guajava]|nr:AAA domain-containing protein [Psidium guajava]